MDVSIIIVNYNTKNMTCDCLRSVIEQTKSCTYEIIVVDNASTDGSVEAIRNLFSTVIILENLENVGFGRANNLALEIANGRFCFLLNSDTILLNDSISLFVLFYEKNKYKLKIGALGSVLLNIEEQAIHSAGIFPSQYRILKNVLMGYFNMINNSKNELEKIEELGGNSFKKVDYVTGANLFILTSILRKFGGFAKEFFMYYEETDLQIRMNQEQLDSFLIEGPRIIHLEGASIGHTSIRKRIVATKSMFIYFKRHSFTLFYYLFRTLYLFIRIPVWFDKRFEKKDKIMYFKTLLRSNQYE